MIVLEVFLYFTKKFSLPLNPSANKKAVLHKVYLP
jgi:hypothetical protein